MFMVMSGINKKIFQHANFNFKAFTSLLDIYNMVY